LKIVGNKVFYVTVIGAAMADAFQRAMLLGKRFIADTE